MFRFSHNWKLKLTSLVIAIALWSHVRGEVNPWEDAVFRVRLVPQPVSPALMLLNAKDIPKFVKVRVNAPRLRLRELKGLTPPNPLATSEEAPLLAVGKMRATLEYALRPGKQVVPVKIVSSVEHLGEITPLPSDITLEFAPSASAELTIEPRFDGPALQDYILEDVMLMPRRAKIFGPAKDVARVAKLIAKVDVPGELAGELRVKAAPLVGLDKAGKVLEDLHTEPATADVSAMVHMKAVTRVVPLSMQSEGQPDDLQSGQARLSVGSVSVTGPKSVVEKLKKIEARINMDDLKATGRAKAKLLLPKDVKLTAKAEVWAQANIPAPAPTPEAARTLPAPAVSP